MHQAKSSPCWPHAMPHDMVCDTGAVKNLCCIVGHRQGALCQNNCAFAGLGRGMRCWSCAPPPALSQAGCGDCLTLVLVGVVDTHCAMLHHAQISLTEPQPWCAHKTNCCVGCKKGASLHGVAMGCLPVTVLQRLGVELCAANCCVHMCMRWAGLLPWTHQQNTATHLWPTTTTCS